MNTADTAFAHVVANLTEEALRERPAAHDRSRVGVVGVATQPDSDSVADSAAGAILAELVGRGAEVRYHDPHVPLFKDDSGYEHKGVTLDALLHWADVLVIVTAHRAVEWDHLYASAELVVDTVNSVRGRTIRERQVLRLGAGWMIPDGSRA